MVIQFNTQSGGVIQFSRNVIDVLQGFRQGDNESKESGGILLGRILLNETDFIVDRVSTPTQDDKATRFSFFRPVKLAQKLVIKVWRKSSGTLNYLGEWHTHPEDTPAPSSADITNWQSIWCRSKTDTDEIFFVIVGRQAIKVWSLCNSNCEPVELKREHF